MLRALSAQWILPTVISFLIIPSARRGMDWADTCFLGHGKDHLSTYMNKVIFWFICQPLAVWLVTFPQDQSTLVTMEWILNLEDHIHQVDSILRGLVRRASWSPTTPYLMFSLKGNIWSNIAQFSEKNVMLQGKYLKYATN